MRFIIIFLFVFPNIAHSAQNKKDMFSVETYLYAIMSANSYEKKDNLPWKLPVNINEVTNTNLFCGICKVRDEKDEKGTGVFNMKKGAQAKVFEILDQNSILKQVVIAYKGSQAWYDMFYGNVRKKHRTRASSFFDIVKKHYPKTEIIVTGHSLGGAMALHVSSTKGANAYVFNSSYRVKDSNPYHAKRVSIEESGDFLAIHRYIWKTPIDIERHKLNCTTKDNHSIAHLSECLLKMAKSKSGIAKKICSLNVPRCN